MARARGACGTHGGRARRVNVNETRIGQGMDDREDKAEEMAAILRNVGHIKLEPMVQAASEPRRIWIRGIAHDDPGFPQSVTGTDPFLEATRNGTMLAKIENPLMMRSGWATRRFIKLVSLYLGKGLTSVFVHVSNVEAFLDGEPLPMPNSFEYYNEMPSHTWPKYVPLRHRVRAGPERVAIQAGTQGGEESMGTVGVSRAQPANPPGVPADFRLLGKGEDTNASSPPPPGRIGFLSRTDCGGEWKDRIFLTGFEQYMGAHPRVDGALAPFMQCDKDRMVYVKSDPRNDIVSFDADGTERRTTLWSTLRIVVSKHFGGGQLGLLHLWNVEAEMEGRPLPMPGYYKKYDGVNGDVDYRRKRRLEDETREERDNRVAGVSEDPKPIEPAAAAMARPAVPPASPPKALTPTNAGDNGHQDPGTARSVSRPATASPGPAAEDDKRRHGEPASMGKWPKGREPFTSEIAAKVGGMLGAWVDPGLSGLRGVATEAGPTDGRAGRTVSVPGADVELMTKLDALADWLRDRAGFLRYEPATPGTRRELILYGPLGAMTDTDEARFARMLNELETKRRAKPLLVDNEDQAMGLLVEILRTTTCTDRRESTLVPGRLAVTTLVGRIKAERALAVLGSATAFLTADINAFMAATGSQWRKAVEAHGKMRTGGEIVREFLTATGALTAEEVVAAASGGRTLQTIAGMAVDELVEHCGMSREAARRLREVLDEPHDIRIPD